MEKDLTDIAERSIKIEGDGRSIEMGFGGLGRLWKWFLD